MYTITHHYLTAGDDGSAIVERETRTVTNPYEIPEVVTEMVGNPGGGGGTTIAIIVSLTESTSL